MKKKEVTYKRSSKDSKFYIGGTVKDCYYIDHFMSHDPQIYFHDGIFYETAIVKLKLIAEMHGCTLREEE